MNFAAFLSLPRTALLAGLASLSVNSIAQVPGDVAPRGYTDGLLNAGDIVVLQEIVLDMTQASADELLKGDIAPPGAVDGVINGADLLLLIRAVAGDVQLSDDLVPLPADTGLITVTDHTTGTVTITGAAGSVEPDTIVDMANLDNGVMASVTAAIDGSFSVMLAGVQGQVISVTVTDAASNTSYPVSVGINTPVALDVTSPTDGSTISGNIATVSGTYTAPPGSAITVNGQVATLHNGSFVIDNIPLSTGQNTLDVLLVNADGLSAAQQLSVTGTSEPLLKVDASLVSGYAPMRCDFSITLSPTVPGVQLFEADLDGDGIYEYASTALQTPLQYTYTTPGLFTARFRVTDAGSAVHSATRSIGVGDALLADVELRGIYNRMLDRLRVGSLSGALNQISGGLRDKYLGIFMSLQSDLSTTVDQLGTLESGPVGSGMAEYLITRTVGGSPKAFPILFLRGEDGVWRIDGM